MYYIFIYICKYLIYIHRKECQQMIKAASIQNYLGTNDKFGIQENEKLQTQPPIICRILSYVLLAQAQTFYFQKAIETKLSNNIISQLGLGISEMYHTALSYVNRQPNKIFKQIDIECKVTWTVYIKYQEQIWKATSWYWHAKNLCEENKYGSEIAYLRYTNEYLEAAIKLEPRISNLKSIISSHRSFYGQVKERQKQSEYDNNIIYFQSIPTKLDTIQSIRKVDFIEYNSLLYNNCTIKYKDVIYKDIFICLIGEKILNKINKIKEELTNIIDNKIVFTKENINIIENIINNESLKTYLPIYHENHIYLNIKYNNNNFKYCLCKLQTVDDYDKYMKINQYKDTIVNYDKDISIQQNNWLDSKKILNTLRNQQDDEKKKDNESRATYNKKWTRKPSDIISKEYYIKIDNLVQIIDQAISSTNDILSIYKKNLYQINNILLVSSYIEYDKLLESINKDYKYINEQNIFPQKLELLDKLYNKNRDLLHGTGDTTVQELYERLKKITNECKNLYKDIVPSTKLTSAYLNVKEEELKKDIDTNFNIIDNDIKEIINDINLRNEINNSKTQVSDINSILQHITEYILNSITLVQEQQDKLNSNNKLYKNLTDDSITGLVTTVNNYLIAREFEYDDYMSNVQIKSAGYLPSYTSKQPSDVFNNNNDEYDVDSITNNFRDTNIHSKSSISHRNSNEYR